MEENKRIAIAEKVTRIPLSEWILVREQGKYDRYETTFNEVPIKIYECVSDGGSPYIVIYDCEFWEGSRNIVAPFFRELREYTKKEEKEKSDKEVDKIYLKMYGK